MKVHRDRCEEQELIWVGTEVPVSVCISMCRTMVMSKHFLQSDNPEIEEEFVQAAINESMLEPSQPILPEKDKCRVCRVLYQCLIHLCMMCTAEWIIGLLCDILH